MWLINYLREVRAEVTHISWPTPRQTAVYTALVLVISVVVAAYVAALDYGFSYLLKLFV